MKVILIHDIMRDVLFRLEDGSKKWYSDMNRQEKAEANKLLLPSPNCSDQLPTASGQ